MTAGPRPSRAWSDALLAARVFALDPAAIGGIRVRARAGPVRDRWLACLRNMLPAATPLRRLPPQVSDTALLGGIDLALSLKAERTVHQRGLLAQADGGVLLVGSAERLEPATAARIAAAMDNGAVIAERDGATFRAPARFGVVAFDESDEGENGPPACLLDRLACHVDLSDVALGQTNDATPFAPGAPTPGEIDIGQDVRAALSAAASAFAIPSLRADVLALRVARAIAALRGDDAVDETDTLQAARLVLAWRARALPAEQDDPVPDADHENPPAQSDGRDSDETEGAPRTEQLEELVVAAARSAMPPGFLDRMASVATNRTGSQPSGRAAQRKQSLLRGRPLGARHGALNRGVRLNVVETLRAAAPWQRLRQRERQRSQPSRAPAPRLLVRGEDIRISRFKQRTKTTIIMAVDASGSSALHRLAEAKGAAQLILADCYVRRDDVGLLTFRRQEAELLLPPTRSLARARRCLECLPAGGATPLATGIDAAQDLAAAVARRGDTPIILLLTDGRANIDRTGQGDRTRAEADARSAARAVRRAGTSALLVDIGPAPRAFAESLADEMGARYFPLPHAAAKELSNLVRTAVP